MEFQGYEILVLIPYTSWIPSYASCLQFADVGDEFDVKILSWAEDRKTYAGSIRDVYPDSDPRSEHWRLSVGDRINAKVVRLVQHADRCGDQPAYLLELRPAAYVMLCARGQEKLSVGTDCEVIVTAINSDSNEVNIEQKV